jgi:hypothetical protein
MYIIAVSPFFNPKDCIPPASFATSVFTSEKVFSYSKSLVNHRKPLDRHSHLVCVCQGQGNIHLIRRPDTIVDIRCHL